MLILCQQSAWLRYLFFREICDIGVGKNNERKVKTAVKPSVAQNVCMTITLKHVSTGVTGIAAGNEKNAEVTIF